MHTFEEILQRIEGEIARMRFPYPPKSLYEPIRYILSLGGKRIRPALTLLACDIYNNGIENAIQPALGRVALKRIPYDQLPLFHQFLPQLP